MEPVVLSTPVHRCAPGDLWLLGGHRLVCGDATDPAAYALLMPVTETALLVVTDPPYGVRMARKAEFNAEYTAATGKAPKFRAVSDVVGDARGANGIVGPAVDAAVHRCAPGCVWYVFSPASPPAAFLEFATALNKYSIWRQTLVWVKNRFALAVMGTDFHFKHENIFYGWVPGKHRTTPDRKQHTVWEFASLSRNKRHPTEKPLPLIRHAVELSSAPGDIVLDPFAGSGTTLIACEATGRRARCIEISTLYCETILHRWEESTGKQAVCGTA